MKSYFDPPLITPRNHPCKSSSSVSCRWNHEFGWDTRQDPVFDPLIRRRRPCKSVIGRELVYPFIPHHLIIEILLRVPVKFLVRFKLVCKQWYSLIKDPYFIQKHLDLTTAMKNGFGFAVLSYDEANGFYYLTSIKERQIRMKGFSGSHYDYYPDECEWEFQDDDDDHDQLVRHPSIKIKCEKYLYMLSCKSLICFDAHPHIHICNPTTNEFLALPPLIQQREEVVVVAGGLGLGLGQGLTSSFGVGVGVGVGVGFGYDSIKKQYKVIEFPMNSPSCKVFTLGSSGSTNESWSKVRNPFYLLWKTNWRIERNGTYVNGDDSIYWIIDRNGFYSSILRFNVGSERLEAIYFPHDLKSFSILQLAELKQNHLSLVEVNEVEGSLDIWMLMKKKHEREEDWRWKKEYSIHICSSGLSAYRRLLWYVYPIYIGGTGGGDGDDQKKILFKSPNGLVSYDLEERMKHVPGAAAAATTSSSRVCFDWKQVYRFPVPPGRGFYCSVGVYIESLVSLHDL